MTHWMKWYSKDRGVKKRKSNQNLMPVSVRGKTYVNAHTASKALKVALITVYTGVINGRPDQIGTGRGSHSKETFKDGLPSKNKPYTILGRSFVSMAAASRYIGCHEDYIKRTIRRVGEERTKALVEEKYMAVAMKVSALEEQKIWKERYGRQRIEA